MRLINYWINQVLVDQWILERGQAASRSFPEFRLKILDLSKVYFIFL